jgi:hypothetical protein
MKQTHYLSIELQQRKVHQGCGQPWSGLLPANMHVWMGRWILLGVRLRELLRGCILL